MIIRKQELEYRHGDALLRGELAWNDESSGRRPGVLVFHEGGGINDHPKRRAAMLAELGYVALACDMYGGGEFAADSKRRGELMGSLLSDPTKLRGRAQAGLDALRSQALADPGKLAAIGFCFGGLTVLELARSGADLAGVASFHGILDTQQPAEPGKIKAKVLVLHGADDPFAPPPKVVAFMDEMRAAGVDWQLCVYGGAQHGFTRPDAAQTGIPGVAYQPEADVRSWRAMRSFFAELFAGGGA